VELLYSESLTQKYSKIRGGDNKKPCQGLLFRGISMVSVVVCLSVCRSSLCSGRWLVGPCRTSNNLFYLTRRPGAAPPPPAEGRSGPAESAGGCEGRRARLRSLFRHHHNHEGQLDQTALGSSGSTHKTRHLNPSPWQCYSLCWRMRHEPKSSGDAKGGERRGKATA
jgi:hypothetical protein